MSVTLMMRLIYPEVLNFRYAAVVTELMAEDTVMPGKILIVEDNSRLAESLAVLLNEAGYETSLATNSGQSGALMFFLALAGWRL